MFYRIILRSRRAPTQAVQNAVIWKARLVWDGSSLRAMDDQEIRTLAQAGSPGPAAETALEGASS